MAPHLTITPDPPVHGQSLLICTQADTLQSILAKLTEIQVDIAGVKGRLLK